MAPGTSRRKPTRFTRPSGRERAPALDPVLRRRAGLTWASLAVERAVRAFWPLAAGIAFALALLLSGLLPVLPGWLHVLALAALAVGLVLLGAWGMRSLSVPARAEVLRRMDTGIPLRPASVLADRIAIGQGDPISERLWELHRSRAANAAAGLRTPAPDLRLSGRDPFALRYAAPLLLLASGLLSWGGWPERLAAAFEPNWDAALLQEVRQLHLEAWAEPPAYTGLAPVYLSEGGGTGKTVELPLGTRLQAWVHDASGVPALVFRDPAANSASAPPGRASFESAESGSFRLEHWEVPDGKVQVEADGLVLAEWQFRVRPDEPPRIEYRSPPQATRTGAATFAYRISDDYGAARAWAEMRPAEIAAGEELLPRRPPFRIPLTLPAQSHVRSGEGGEEFIIRDLLSHPWAGAEVLVSLSVEDDIGQTGRSAAIPFRLPAHEFEDPMARAFAEQRRELALSSDLGELVFAHSVLEAAIRHPSDYFDDPVSFLAARVASERLDAMIGRGVTGDGLADVESLLWRAARRLDEGMLPDVLEELRSRLRAVEEALEQAADPGELHRLLEELRAAAERYLKALVDAGQNREDTPLSFDARQSQIRSEALDEVLQAIRDAASVGSREMARRQLAQLRSILENLEARPPGPLEQDLTGLGGIIQDQTLLADETLRLEGDGAPSEAGGQAGAGSPGGGPGNSGSGGASLAGRQAGLLRRLEALRERMMPGEDNGTGARAGRFGNELDEASDSMGRAAGALGEGQLPEALAAQRQALESLHGAAMALVGQDGGLPGSGVPGSAAGGFGQGSGSRWGTSLLPGLANPFGDVGLPDQRSLQLAREILEEIRQKSSDRLRPESERNYYRRLIDRF